MAGPRHDPSLYRERDVVPIRRALVSVSDKTDLLVLAEALAGAGVEIVSTGSTAATIRDAGFEVTDHITLAVDAASVALETVRRNKDVILPDVLADEYTEGRPDGFSREQTINGEDLFLTVRKL